MDAMPPLRLVWEGFKIGMIVLPFETKPGEYFALPLFIVVPAILILMGLPAITAMYMSKARSKERAE
jgi:hypothetical protein